MSSTESTHKPLVVCIKYDRNIGKLIRDYLEKNGFRSIYVADPTAILDYLPDIMPDMILTDLNFPSLYGLDVLQQLKADSRTARMPVIIICPDSRPDTIVRAFKIGASDYLVIPFELRELLARMEIVLNRLKGLRRAISVSRGELEWMP